MKLSVVTVCRNPGNMLIGTIKSVITQTYCNIEYIIVDGASSDGTVDTIKLFAEKNTNIKWISEPDSGIYNAMNKAICLTTGDFIFFLNAGDILFSESVIEQFTDIVKKNKEVRIFSGLMATEQSGVLEFHGGHFSFIKKWKMFFWNVQHPTLFYSRSLFLKHGLYNERFHIAADYELILRFFIRGNEIILHMPLVVSIFDCNGISSKKENILKIRSEVFEIRNMYFDGFYRIINKNKLLEVFTRALMKRMFQ